MKKLIAVVLILALLLPAGALASSNDLIIGFWYLLVDNGRYPELMKNYGDFDYVLSAYLFSEDGNIYLLESDIKDGAATPIFSCCGTWEIAQGIRKYSYQMMGLGQGSIRLEEGGDMYISVQNDSFSLHLRMMFPFNPYLDYVYGESGK